MNRRLLLLAAAAAASTASTAPTFAQTLSEAEKTHDTSTAAIGMASLRMADMALEKARGTKVKEFAQFERDEQTTVGEILKSMDPDLGSPNPPADVRSKLAPSLALMLAAGPRLIFGFLSTPSMLLEPFVDHGVSQQFGLFAVTVYHFSVAFNVLRMNGYDPLVPFDPGADRISYSPVFHSDMIALSLEGGNARIGGALITLEVGRNTHCRG